MSSTVNVTLFQMDMDNLNGREMHYQDFDSWQKKGIEFSDQMYKPAYHGKIEIGENVPYEKMLSMLFDWFNLNPPEEFKGTGMEVSDVLHIHYQVQEHLVYVEPRGWHELDLGTYTNMFSVEFNPLELASDILKNQNKTVPQWKRDIAAESINKLNHVVDFPFTGMNPVGGSIWVMEDVVSEIKSKYDVSEEKARKMAATAVDSDFARKFSDNMCGFGWDAIDAILTACFAEDPQTNK